MNSLYDISVQKPNGEIISMSEYRWKVLLIVNTATKCGLAPQLRELEELWNTYSHEEFMVLGFPCNQFLGQEPETNETVEEVCKINFGVTFPIFAKIDVNWANTHPLFKFLKSKSSWFWSRSIKWNFTKFLIDQEWNIVQRYAPNISPISINNTIANLINR